MKILGRISAFSAGKMNGDAVNDKKMTFLGELFIYDTKLQRGICSRETKVKNRSIL